MQLHQYLTAPHQTVVLLLDTTVVTIIDDDPTMITSTGDKTITEGGATTITVTLGRTLEEDERIDLVLSRDSASTADPSDYRLGLRRGMDFNTGVTYNGTTLTFVAGAKVATLQIMTLNDDNLTEGTEQLILNIVSPDTNSNTIGGGATLSSGSETRQITIDESGKRPTRVRAKVLLEGPLQ